MHCYLPQIYYYFLVYKFVKIYGFQHFGLLFYTIAKIILVSTFVLIANCTYIILPTFKETIILIQKMQGLLSRQ